MIIDFSFGGIFGPLVHDRSAAALVTFARPSPVESLALAYALAVELAVVLVHLDLEAVRVFEDERAAERFVGDAARKGCELGDGFERLLGDHRQLDATGA